jgi:hypothetical protein
VKTSNANKNQWNTGFRSLLKNWFASISPSPSARVLPDAVVDA